MPPNDSERIALLRSQLAIRVFEEAVQKQLAAGLIPGSVHLSIGHEGAIAARSVIAVEDIADRAAGYGIPGMVVDGQDAEAVYAVTAEAVEAAFHCLKAPIVRITTPDVPIPFSPSLEDPLYPSTAAIVDSKTPMMTTMNSEKQKDRSRMRGGTAPEWHDGLAGMLPV